MWHRQILEPCLHFLCGQRADQLLYCSVCNIVTAAVVVTASVAAVVAAAVVAAAILAAASVVAAAVAVGASASGGCMWWIRRHEAAGPPHTDAPLGNQAATAVLEEAAPITNSNLACSLAQLGSLQLDPPGSVAGMEAQTAVSVASVAHSIAGSFVHVEATRDMM